jgi:hypothetical protein
MAKHKFGVGQVVRFSAEAVGRYGPDGHYKVVQLLPPDFRDNQYRIQCLDEGPDRLAKESELQTLPNGEAFRPGRDF